MTSTPPAQALAPDVIDEFDDVLVAVQRIPRRPVYQRRLIEPLQLSGGLGMFRTLRAVERASSEAPSIGDVAEALAIDPSTASRAVERCVLEGLLSRVHHEADRRKARLRLTDAGRAVLERASRNRREVLVEVAGHWPEADVLQLVSLLRALLEGFDRLEPGA